MVCPSGKPEEHPVLQARLRIMLRKEQRNDIVYGHDARAGKPPAAVVDPKGVVKVDPGPGHAPRGERLVEKRGEPLVLVVEPSDGEGLEVWRKGEFLPGPVSTLKEQVFVFPVYSNQFPDQVVAVNPCPLVTRTHLEGADIQGKARSAGSSVPYACHGRLLSCPTGGAIDNSPFDQLLFPV